MQDQILRHQAALTSALVAGDHAAAHLHRKEIARLTQEQDQPVEPKPRRRRRSRAKSSTLKE